MVRKAPPVLLYIHGGSYETGGGFTLKCNGENMAEYFANFVKTGKPHGEGMPEWKPITRDSHLFMHFGDAPCAMYSVPEERLHGQELKNKPFPGM